MSIRVGETCACVEWWSAALTRTANKLNVHFTQFTRELRHLNGTHKRRGVFKQNDMQANTSHTNQHSRRVSSVSDVGYFGIFGNVENVLYQSAKCTVHTPLSDEFLPMIIWEPLKLTNSLMTKKTCKKVFISQSSNNIKCQCLFW